MPTKPIRRTRAQRQEQFWLEWCDRMQSTLGALLAATIDETPSTDDDIYGCVNQLIDVEQQLAGILRR